MTRELTRPPQPALALAAGGHPARPAEDDLAAALRGFGPIGLLAILAILFTGNVVAGRMVVLPVGAVIVLIWTWWSRTPWRDIGYARPPSWVLTLAAGVAFGVAFKLVMKAIVMPLLGADPINQAYHFLAGNRAMLPAALWAMVVAGFAEETLYRGYLFERLGKLCGSGAGARTAILVFTSAWFGFDHYAVQGLAGAQQATIVGLVFGAIVMSTGRVWMAMCAHSAFNLTALAIIYWDLETAVARFVFR